MQAVLCYVEDSWAYFTTQKLADQWGDDWNDAPYEHNAGTPYKFDDHDRRSGVEPWEIIEVPFTCNLEAPDAWVSNSQFSVEHINGKAVPWLQSGKYGTKDSEGHPIQIWAGIPLSEFITLIHKAGGDVFLKHEKA